MNNVTFGELVFNTGWKTNTNIKLFGNNCNIIVKVKAYLEEDGVTSEQENAYNEFRENESECLETAEKLLSVFANGNASERFTPRTLLFQRDGSYALLLDDKDDEDGGVVVCLAPKVGVVTQDDYL